jgi:hypothetical protein
MALNHSGSEENEGFRFAGWPALARGRSEARSAQAELSLRRTFQPHDVAGTRFLDLGCGLFSFAARRLDARVNLVDFAARSATCTQHLRGRVGG